MSNVDNQLGCRPRFRKVCAFAVAAILGASSHAGTLVYVDGGSRGGDGTSWEQAFPRLQDALSLAATPGSGVTQIWVAGGTYRPTQLTGRGDARSATFALVSGVELYGHFVGTERTVEERDLSDPAGTTVLSGDLAGNDGRNFSGNEENAYHVVTATNVGLLGLRLDGFTVTAGHANGLQSGQAEGGGLYAQDNDSLGELLVTNCVFSANKAGGSAGALLVKGRPVFDHCMFQGNASSNHGGGVTFQSTTPTISGCSFIGNVASGSASNGGGIYISTLLSSIEILDCVFEGNTATGNGGGLCINPPLFSNLFVSLRDCTFRGNQVLPSPFGFSNGGGVYVEFIEPFLTECRFISNVANRHGGGIYIFPTAFFPGSPGQFVLCDFRGNHAAFDGGGSYIHSAKNHQFLSCLYSGNSAGNGGAGLMLGLTGGNPRDIANCTFVGNVAIETGGGLVAMTPGDRVTNCVFWDNQDASGVGESGQLTVGSPAGNVNYCCVLGWTGALGGVGNHGLDPLLVDAIGPDRRKGTEDDDASLGPGSPCIDAGSNLAIPSAVTEDLAGSPRFQDDPRTIDTGLGIAPIVDMGAYEFQPFDPADLDEDGDVDGFDLALLLGQWTGASTYAPCPPHATADLNADCKINGFDLALLLGAWHEK